MELLLVFSVCLLLGAADGQGLTVTTVHVKEDSDASLPCSIPENLEKKFFAWKKDGQTNEVFLYDAGRAEPVDGRVSHYESGLQSGNASIVIRGAKLTDNGNYSCFYTINKELKSRVELIVDCILKDRRGEKKPGTCPKPSAKVIDETEGWRLLQCVVHGAFPEPEVQWRDGSGHIIPAENPQVTEKDGRFDIILNTTVTKTGNYKCVVTQRKICHTIHDVVPVKFLGAADKPSVTILEETKDQALLECKVLGASAKPAVWWEDSSGNKLPAKEEKGGKSEIVLHTTVTKTDHYHCVVSPEGSDHRTDKQIYVFISDQTNIKLIIGLSAGVFVGVFVGIFVGIFLGRSGKVCRGSSGDKSYQSAEKDPESVNTPDPV